ncbi:type VII secretion system-associated protein [Streptomyces sp. NPDC093675]|uniref:type VII secretion system-associated protein n=1 Tax=Streptomyces sp. NPDC093675 TaxID=3366049 RepID=UPI00382058B8
MADLTRLDTKTLQKFLDNDVKDFSGRLDDIQKDDSNGVRALHSIVTGQKDPATLGENPVLGIGPMANDDELYGQSLIKNITTAASQIDDIFTGQKKLFGDIQTDLETVIKTLLKGQSDSLDTIDGEKMLDPFGDIDDDLSSFGGGKGDSSGS